MQIQQTTVARFEICLREDLVKITRYDQKVFLKKKTAQFGLIKIASTLQVEECVSNQIL